MDFELSPEQMELRTAVRAFAREALNDRLEQRDEDGAFPRDCWQKCAEFGLLGLPVPAEFGGQGQDLVTTTIAMEALGWGCRDNGLVFSLNAQMWAVEMPLVHYGTQAQKREWLPGLVSGKLIGVQLAGRFLRWPAGEATLIGWLLQTKALIMIIFANVLLDKGVITADTFTALLLMAVASTMLTVPMVTPLLVRLRDAAATRVA